MSLYDEVADYSWSYSIEKTPQPLIYLKAQRKFEVT